MTKHIIIKEKGKGSKKQIGRIREKSKDAIARLCLDWEIERMHKLWGIKVIPRTYRQLQLMEDAMIIACLCREKMQMKYPKTKGNKRNKTLKKDQRNF